MTTAIFQSLLLAATAAFVIWVALSASDEWPDDEA